MRSNIVHINRLLSAERRIQVALRQGSTVRIATEVLAHSRADKLDRQSMNRLAAVADGAPASVTDYITAKRCANFVLRGAAHA